MTELQFSLKVAEAFTTRRSSASRPTTSHGTDMTLVDLYHNDEASQNFAMDFASVKEEMISKSKVHGFSSFRSGIRKKDVSAVTHDQPTSRPHTMEGAAPTAFHFLDTEGEKNDLISLRYGFTQMDEEFKSPSIKQNSASEMDVFDVPSILESASRGKSEDRSSNRSKHSEGKISNKSNYSDKDVVNNLPSSFAEALLPTILTAEGEKSKEAPSEVSSSRNWLKSDDDAGEVYVPGQSSKTNATKAQQLLAERERLKAIQEEERIEREKEKKRLAEFQAAKEAMLSQNKVQSVGFSSLKAGLTKRAARSSTPSATLQNTTMTASALPDNTDDNASLHSSDSRSYQEKENLRSSVSSVVESVKEDVFARPLTADGFAITPWDDGSNHSIASVPKVAENLSNDAATNQLDIDVAPKSANGTILSRLLSLNNGEIKLKPRVGKSRGDKRRPNTRGNVKTDEVNSVEEMKMESFLSTESIEPSSPHHTQSSSVAPWFKSRPNSSGKVHPIAMESPEIFGDEISQYDSKVSVDTLTNAKELFPSSYNEGEIEQSDYSEVTVVEKSPKPVALKQKQSLSPSHTIKNARFGPDDHLAGLNFFADERLDGFNLQEDFLMSQQRPEERHTVNSFVSPSLLDDLNNFVNNGIATEWGEIVDSETAPLNMRKKPKSKRGKRQKLVIERDN